MTRKDYVLIAKAIKDARAEAQDPSWSDLSAERVVSLVADNLAAALAAENTAFKPAIFIAATQI